MRGRTRSRLPHPVYLLLVIPFVALLWTPFYNRLQPTLFGIPFFYWYQIAWTPVTALLIGLVHLHRKRRK
jgi:Protein of unknown function (DUF3311)